MKKFFVYEEPEFNIVKVASRDIVTSSIDVPPSGFGDSNGFTNQPGTSWGASGIEI